MFFYVGLVQSLIIEASSRESEITELYIYSEIITFVRLIKIQLRMNNVHSMTKTRFIICLVIRRA